MFGHSKRMGRQCGSAVNQAPRAPPLAKGKDQKAKSLRPIASTAGHAGRRQAPDLASTSDEHPPKGFSPSEARWALQRGSQISLLSTDGHSQRRIHLVRDAGSASFGTRRFLVMGYRGGKFWRCVIRNLLVG